MYPAGTRNGPVAETYVSSMQLQAGGVSQILCGLFEDRYWFEESIILDAKRRFEGESRCANGAYRKH